MLSHTLLSADFMTRYLKDNNFIQLRVFLNGNVTCITIQRIHNLIDTCNNKFCTEIIDKYFFLIKL